MLGIDPHTIKLNRQNPLTTHVCPSSSARKFGIIQKIQDALIAIHAGELQIKLIA